MGWKKTKDLKTLVNFEHSNGYSKIVVEKPDKDSQWTVTDEDGYRKASLSSSKSLAVSKARKWMREHPRG